MPHLRGGPAVSWVRDSNRDTAGHRGWSMHCDHPGCTGTTPGLSNGWTSQLTDHGYTIHWCGDHWPKEDRG